MKLPSLRSLSFACAAILIAAAGFSLPDAVSAAENAINQKAVKTDSAAGQSQKPSVTIQGPKITAPDFSSGFVFHDSPALSVGKLFMASTTEKPTDLRLFLSGLDKTQWRSHCLMISKDDGIKTSYILVPASGVSKYGMIGLHGLDLNTVQSLVNTVAGNSITFLYDQGALKIQMPGSKEVIIIATAEDVKKHTDSMTSSPGAGASKIAVK